MNTKQKDEFIASSVLAILNLQKSFGIKGKDRFFKVQLSEKVLLRIDTIPDAKQTIGTPWVFPCTVTTESGWFRKTTTTNEGFIALSKGEFIIAGEGLNLTSLPQMHVVEDILFPGVPEEEAELITEEPVVEEVPVVAVNTQELNRINQALYNNSKSFAELNMRGATGAYLDTTKPDSITMNITAPDGEKFRVFINLSTDSTEQKVGTPWKFGCYTEVGGMPEEIGFCFVEDSKVLSFAFFGGPGSFCVPLAIATETELVPENERVPIPAPVVEEAPIPVVIDSKKDLATMIRALVITGTYTFPQAFFEIRKIDGRLYGLQFADDVKMLYSCLYGEN